MDTADRNYIESLIVQAQTATRVARDVAGSYGLVHATEKLTFAVEFQQHALRRLADDGRNPDGTAGPEHVTSEGVELGPPKG